MDPIQVATKITSPLALVAFLAALALYAYQRWLAERRKNIESASPKDRPPLIEAAIRDFTILNTDPLTPHDRYLVVLRALENQMRRFLIAAIVAVVVTLALLATLVTLERKEHSENPSGSSKPEPVVRISDDDARTAIENKLGEGDAAGARSVLSLMKPGAAQAEECEHVYDQDMIKGKLDEARSTVELCWEGEAKEKKLKDILHERLKN